MKLHNFEKIVSLCVRLLIHSVDSINECVSSTNAMNSGCNHDMVASILDDAMNIAKPNLIEINRKKRKKIQFFFLTSMNH